MDFNINFIFRTSSVMPNLLIIQFLDCAAGAEWRLSLCSACIKQEHRRTVLVIDRR